MTRAQPTVHTRVHALAAGLALLAAAQAPAAAQRPDAGNPAAAADTAAAAAAAGPAARPRPGGRRPAPFFATEAPLAVTLTLDLRRLRGDLGEHPPWRPATVAWTDTAGLAHALPVRVRARGVWRRRNCALPPLRLDFADSAARDTPFARLGEPKLVNVCHDDDTHEQFVLAEAQLYRVLALLTPASHRARLVRVAYADARDGRPFMTRHALVLEAPDALARRLGGRMLHARGARARDLDPYQAALVGVFQYMVGNHDWSTAGLHNVELVADTAGGTVRIVPYDFDFSGAVDAPYATVDPLLPVRRVRERYYRGHCAPAAEYARVFARFQEQKAAIYALYADPVGRLLAPARARATLRYFDEFYATLNAPARARRAIVDACVEAQ